jgi:hypothetical protein
MPNSCIGPFGMCTPQLYLYDEVLSTQNGDHMPELHLREVDVSTTPIKAHKPFVVSSSRVRVLDV